MSSNGISHLVDKADRRTAKLALADAARSAALPMVVSGGTTWQFQVFVPTTFRDWKVSTAYLLNEYVRVPSNGHYYKCTVAGTTAAAEPVWPTNYDHRPLNVLNTGLVAPTLGRPWQV
jgi:hypothetical protein